MSALTRAKALDMWLLFVVEQYSEKTDQITRAGYKPPVVIHLYRCTLATIAI